MGNKGILVGLGVVVVIAAVAAALVSGGKSKTSYQTNTPSSSQHQMSPSESNTTSSSSQPAETTSVDIKDMAYTPATIKVKVGSTVTWTNHDNVQHDVVADTPSADAPNSSLLSQGETYKFTFTKAGTYSYHCSIHPYMTATVIVE